MNNDAKKYRPLEICFVLGTIIVIGSSFFWANASSAGHMIMILLSVFISLLTLPLALYAIGFTRIRSSMIAMTAIATILSVWTTHWPSNLRFQLAANQFENLAAEIRDGNSQPTPVWVGTFYVKRIEQNHQGAICFWTNLHSYGRTGVIHAHEDQLQFNISLIQELDPNWYLLSED